MTNASEYKKQRDEIKTRYEDMRQHAILREQQLTAVLIEREELKDKLALTKDNAQYLTKQNLSLQAENQRLNAQLTQANAARIQAEMDRDYAIGERNAVATNGTARINELKAQLKQAVAALDAEHAAAGHRINNLNEIIGTQYGKLLQLRIEHQQLKDYNDRVCRECDDLKAELQHDVKQAQGALVEARDLALRRQVDIDTLREQLKDARTKNVNQNLLLGNATREVANKERQLQTVESMLLQSDERVAILQAWYDLVKECTVRWSDHGVGCGLVTSRTNILRLYFLCDLFVGVKSYKNTGKMPV